MLINVGANQHDRSCNESTVLKAPYTLLGLLMGDGNVNSTNILDDDKPAQTRKGDCLGDDTSPTFDTYTCGKGSVLACFKAAAKRSRNVFE